MEQQRNPDLDPAERDETFEYSLRPQSLPEYIGQEKVKARLEIALRAALGRREVLDHVLLFGPPGPGQDHPGPRPRQRDGRPLQGDPGPGPGKEGRPGGDPHQPGRGRVPVHRRDPPDARGHRGDALFGHGGPQAGHPHRPGPLGPDPQGRPAAVHPGGRHHPGRAHLQAPARPLRDHPPAGVLHPGRTGHHRQPLGPRAGGGAGRRRRRGHRPALAAAPRASSTACCAAAGTTPR